jgi:hypothetical protein
MRRPDAFSQIVQQQMGVRQVNGDRSYVVAKTASVAARIAGPKYESTLLSQGLSLPQEFIDRFPEGSPARRLIDQGRKHRIELPEAASR